MKYLRKFASEADYNAFKDSDSYVTPNVVLVNGKVDYNPVIYPLYIEARESLNVSFSNSYEYSKDNVTWTSAVASSSISANAGEKVYFRASGLEPTTSNGIGSFNITNGKCNVGGNIMSMAYGANFDGQTIIKNNYQFYKLFNECTNIVDASKLLLPATSLAPYCYQSMFAGCTSLTSAPALPATTLVDYCYSSMFNNCTSLVNAPALPATTLEYNCYNYMFYGCTSLVTAPALPATTLASNCYNNMFNGCSNLNYIKAMFTTTPSTSYTRYWVKGVSASGTFVKNSAATWADTFGANAIPSGWTVETANA